LRATRALLAALVGCAAALAQPSPSTLNFSARWHGDLPYFQSTTITGAPTAVGTCTDVNLGDGTGLCGDVQRLVSGQTLYVYWSNNNLFNIGSVTATKNYQSTIVAVSGGACPGSGCLTVNLTLGAVFADPWFQSTSGLFPGCVLSSSNYRDTFGDTCPTPNGRPGGTYVPLATNGSKELDAEFGTLITRVSPSGTQRAIGGDAISTQISSDDTLVATTDLSGSGNEYLTSTTGAGELYTLPPAQNLNVTLDPLLPYFYYLPHDGTNTVMRSSWTNNFATPTAMCTYSGGGSSYLSNSNDGRINKLGWYATLTSASTAHKIFLCNVYTGQNITFDLASPLITTLGNLPQVRGDIRVSKDFDYNNKMWIEMSGQVSGGLGATELFSLTKGASVIVDEGPLPFNPAGYYNNGGTPGPMRVQPTSSSDCTPGWCPTSEHEDWFNVNFPNGSHVFRFLGGGPSSPTLQYAAAQDFSLGVTGVFVDTEAGGGQYLVALLNSGQDTHHSCADLAAVCVFDTDGNDPPTTGYQITNVTTSGGNPTITSSPNYGGGNGDTLLVNNVGGITGMAGIAKCHVASLSGATFNCDNLTTSGTYTANTGAFTLDVFPSAFPHQNETVFVDFTNIASKQITFRRLRKHASLGLNDHLSAGGYYGQPHTTISADGTLACGTSNHGIPDYYLVECFPTGYPNRVSAAAVGAAAVGAAR
jgi:hypothetical protein